MAAEYKVIDNYLPESHFNNLVENLVWNGNFPMHLIKNVAYDGCDAPKNHSYKQNPVSKLFESTFSADKKKKEDYRDWYASHLVYQAPTLYDVSKDYISNLQNIFVDKLIKEESSPALLRIKVNFYASSDRVYEHSPHVDYPFKSRGAILSLNTCDGFTRLYDGTKVDSVANRLLLFDPTNLHNSSTTTTVGGRWNININYV